MNDKSPLIILAAGGTGGHIFPAQALGKALLQRGMRVALLTDGRGARFSDDVKIPVYRTMSSRLGDGVMGKILTIIKLGIGVLQARHYLKKQRPAAVVGFGGYPAIPAVYAAANLGIPIILHDQNAILGRVNKLMAGKATTIATSYPQIVGLQDSLKTKLVQTGNPTRPQFATLRDEPYHEIQEKSPIRILILGGSQGARVLSKVVPQTMKQMPDDLRRRLMIIQQCRAEDIEEARAVYASGGVEAELGTFFHDVPEKMSSAHLIISRSGGSTIAEITTIGRPSILVPYPHGHAGEQIANAQAITAAGGGWLIPENAFTAESLAMRLESILRMPSLLTKAATSAREWGRPMAAENLADCVMQIIGEMPPEPTRGTKS